MEQDADPSLPLQHEPIHQIIELSKTSVCQVEHYKDRSLKEGKRHKNMEDKSVTKIHKVSLIFCFKLVLGLF